jgi:hypothetical protein
VLAHLVVIVHPSLRERALRCAASLRGGGGASRVAPSGTRRPTKEGVGEGRGPTPAGSPRLGRSSAEPPESPALDRQGHVPGLGFGACGVEVMASLGCLSGGLAADAEGASDVGPGRSLGSCCVDHESRCGVEAGSGVSQGLEVLDGPLWAAGEGLERGQGPADPPSGCGACLGAHVNGSCHRSVELHPVACEFRLRNANCANRQLAANYRGSRRRALGVVALISSCISRHGHPRAALTTKKNDPRETAISGGQITSQEC